METQHLTNSEVETLKTAFASAPYQGKTAKEILSLLLGRPQIENPEEPQQIPKPMTVTEIMQLIPNDEYLGLSQQLKSDVNKDVKAQDHYAVALWGQDQLRIGKLSQNTYDTIYAAINQTISDPNYEATIPAGYTRIEDLLNRFVDALKAEEIETILEDM